jgi:tripartite-type tricarboxylate transporter receptor subunit TctC
MSLRKSAVALVWGVALSLLAVLPAGAQTAAEKEAAEFYKGKQIKLLIGGGAGGNYDTYARIFERHLRKHIPGNPEIVPQNIAGAGGITAANQIYTGPADGTLIGAMPRTLPLDPLLYDRKFEFDALKFNWLGSLAVETNMIITWHTSPIKTAEDLWKHEGTFAATAQNTDGVIFSRLINDFLGGKMKPIIGYKGSPEMFLAMERGEANGRAGVPWSTIRTAQGDWVKEKKINLVTQLALVKDPDLPNVPLLLDYVKNPEHRAAFEVLFIRQEMGRPYVLSPNMAPDRVKVLRDAFAKTTKDKDYMAEMQKADLDINLRTGEEVQALVKKAYAAPPAAVNLLKTLLKD